MVLLQIALCHALQFVINKFITNCGVITNCVVSCAAICNKQAYYKLRRYYKLRGDKAIITYLLPADLTYKVIEIQMYV